MSTVTGEQIAQAFVLNVTDEASAKIQNILKERNVPNHGLRVFVAGGGCSGLQYGMALESRAQDTDQVLEVAGLKLFVDPTSAEYLDGATIDYQDDSMNSGFRIENPNAAPTCTCGSNSSSGGCGCH